MTHNSLVSGFQEKPYSSLLGAVAGYQLSATLTKKLSLYEKLPNLTRYGLKPFVAVSGAGFGMWGAQKLVRNPYLFCTLAGAVLAKHWYWSSTRKPIVVPLLPEQVVSTEEQVASHPSSPTPLGLKTQFSDVAGWEQNPFTSDPIPLEYTVSLHVKKTPPPFVENRRQYSDEAVFHSNTFKGEVVENDVFGVEQQGDSPLSVGNSADEASDASSDAIKRSDSLRSLLGSLEPSTDGDDEREQEESSAQPEHAVTVVVSESISLSPRSEKILRDPTYV